MNGGETSPMRIERLPFKDGVNAGPIKIGRRAGREPLLNFPVFCEPRLSSSWRPSSPVPHR
jgi:hypothetical protein